MRDRLHRLIFFFFFFLSSSPTCGSGARVGGCWRCHRQPTLPSRSRKVNAAHQPRLLLDSVEDRHSLEPSAVWAAARIGTRRPGWSHTSAYRAGPHRTHVTRESRNLWRRNHLVYEVGEIAQPNNGCIPRPVATRDAWLFDCARHDQRGSDRRSSLNFSLFHLWFLSRGARVHDVCTRVSRRRVGQGRLRRHVLQIIRNWGSGTGTVPLPLYGGCFVPRLASTRRLR